MPEYSRAAHERDVYGELGWVNNFSVKFSKNNDKLHPNYREFFDIPKNHQTAYTNMTMTNTDFFRRNAPKGSVAAKPSGKNSKGNLTMTNGFRTMSSVTSPKKLQ